MGRLSDAMEGRDRNPPERVLIRKLAAVTSGLSGLSGVEVALASGNAPARWLAGFESSVAAGRARPGVDVLVMLVKETPVVIDVVGG